MQETTTTTTTNRRILLKQPSYYQSIFNSQIHTHSQKKKPRLKELLFLPPFVKQDLKKKNSYGK